MKRVIAVAVGAAIAVVLPAGSAWAGEWNPARQYIFSPPNENAGEHSKVLVHPNDDSAVGPAASICSFSGRDDTDAEDDADWALSPAGGLVQSPGQVTATFKFAPLQGTGCGPGGGE